MRANFAASFVNLLTIIALARNEASATKKLNSLCVPPMIVAVSESDTTKFDNDTLLHEGVLYPSDMHWSDEKGTHLCACEMTTCLRKCCRANEVLSASEPPKCISKIGITIPQLKLKDDQLIDELNDIKNLDEMFSTVISMSCPNKSYRLEPEKFPEDNFILQPNGSLVTGTSAYPQWMYCLDWHESLNNVNVLVCMVSGGTLIPETVPKIYQVGMMISVPFLFATFLVYAIIPELRNIYGKTLMCYVACLVCGYIFLSWAYMGYLPPLPCTILAFVIHFSFLASFFWLNVMCFDIWWTFGGFRALRGSVKQRERKKFIMYSIYAWGSAALLTGICIIMDFVPSVPKHFIKPGFGTERCWFHTDKAKAVYFYGPMGVTVLCNICLFISTAMKILQHKKDTAHHLKGSESRRHDDNKQWFNLYLKLFIVMGISWAMEIISWLFEKNTPDSAWYITDIANTLQGLIIFIIFVWKDKIKRLLLKRFGCQGPNVLSRNSTRSAYHSSASRTCTTSVPLQEKINPSIHEAYRAKVISEESDCA